MAGLRSVWRSESGRALRELLETVVVAVALALLIRAFVVESFLVQGNSMEPSLFHGERLLVYKLGYLLSDPQPGDIVVFHYPKDPSRDFIKRIIAGPGDRIRMEAGRIFRNGERVHEPYLLNPDSDYFPEKIVPPGSYFVMGDNRNNSEDSREFGFVESHLIIGKAFVVYWPPEELRLLH